MASKEVSRVSLSLFYFFTVFLTIHLILIKQVNCNRVFGLFVAFYKALTSVWSWSKGKPYSGWNTILICDMKISYNEQKLILSIRNFRKVTVVFQKCLRSLALVFLILTTKKWNYLRFWVQDFSWNNLLWMYCIWKFREVRKLCHENFVKQNESIVLLWKSHYTKFLWNKPFLSHGNFEKFLR